MAPPTLRPAALAGLLVVAALSCAAPEASQQPPTPAPPPADPSVRTLDRLLARRAAAERSEPGAATDQQRCQQLAAAGGCTTAAGLPRVLSLRLLLDERYPRQWPRWQQRLERTLSCVNQLYQGTGISWEVAELLPWDPGDSRHDLRQLLQRLRQLPPHPAALTLGLTVWEERKIYRSAPGEIGLSQGNACVVPSWPRAENDCLILAHELGHLVGARHVPGKGWIMGWAARPFHLPAADPIARVVASYRFHPRNVAAIRAHRRATLTPRGLALPAACREQLRQLDSCWGLSR